MARTGMGERRAGRAEEYGLRERVCCFLLLRSSLVIIK